jgi:hypothetical protein
VEVEVQLRQNVVDEDLMQKSQNFLGL